jgi:hypothetical protein
VPQGRRTEQLRYERGDTVEHATSVACGRGNRVGQLKGDIAAGQFERDDPTLDEIAALRVRYPNPAV